MEIVVRVVVRFVEHHMLVLVRYEGGKLIYTHCHVTTSHQLGRCIVQTVSALWHMRKSPHNSLTRVMLCVFRRVSLNLKCLPEITLEGNFKTSHRRI